MTLIEERPAAVDEARRQAAEPAPTDTPVRPVVEPNPVASKIALSLVLAALLLLGFGAYLFAFSGLSEQRAQTNLRKTFSYALAQAVAPTGPTGEGKPVAVIDIPKIGVHNLVVVEGTSSRDLMSGPGHLRASVLPGQAGTSTIYGKRATFGAPFRRLLDLQPGDRIRVSTGQGVSTYVVSSFGNTANPAPANSTNRLVLLTADSGFTPNQVVVVSADLTSAVQPVPGSLHPIVASDKPLARAVDTSIIPLAGWSQVLLLTALAGTFALARWPRWPTVLCLTPIVLAVVWSVYENAAGLLPNVV